MQKKKYTLNELNALYQRPLFVLIKKAHEILQIYHPDGYIQKAMLFSIKTGGCPENCSYCAQSIHNPTGKKVIKKFADKYVDDVIKKAKQTGATRLCLSAAWRRIKDGMEFNQILVAVRKIKSEGFETCATLGMIQPHQAKQLKQAGLDVYNHNLDSSREFYPKFVTSRTYDDRLKTIKIASEYGLQTCCGGIIGMGETDADRISMIYEISQLDPEPTSVPINLLMPVKGSPLENQKPVSIIELLKIIALARIAVPKAMVRLSAGRLHLSEGDQILCFYAGANSIFVGDRLLTQNNPGFDQDVALLEALS